MDSGWVWRLRSPLPGLFRLLKAKPVHSIKAIETKYKGYRFRSRLEARWAVFFETLGAQWDYEPEGFQLQNGWYLPDFRVRYREEFSNFGPGETFWFEVKPILEDIDAYEDLPRLREFEEAVGNFLILDGVPDRRMYCGLKDMLEERESSNDRICAHPPGGRPASGLALWSHKCRPWWDEHDNFWGPGGLHDVNEKSRRLGAAIDAARSARFEHKELA